MTSSTNQDKSTNNSAVTGNVSGTDLGAAASAWTAAYMVPSTPKFKYLGVEDPFEMDEDALFEEIAGCGVPLLEAGVCLARGRSYGSPLALIARMTTLASCSRPKVSVATEIGSRPIPLNFLYSFAAPSGLGKGNTMGAPLRVESPLQGYRTVTAASGEALIAEFFDTVPAADGKGKEISQHDEPVIAVWNEIDQFTAKSSGEASTLDTIMRSLWSGERVGDKSISRMKAGFGCQLEENSYTFNGIIGAQLTRAGKLLDDETGGLLQRIIWMPLTDTDAPSRAEARTYRARLETILGLPAGACDRRAPSLTVWGPGGAVTLEEEIHDILFNDRQAYLNGTSEASELDTHNNNNRVRLAVVFAAWVAGPGKPVHVDMAAWHWAGCMLAISKKTRELCKAAQEVAKLGVSTDKGKTLADIEAAKKAALDAKQRKSVDACKRRLVEIASEHETDTGDPAQSSTFTARLSTAQRKVFTLALKELVVEDALKEVVSSSNLKLYPTGSHADQYMDAA